MAGKADLVNSIVDRVELQSIPEKDGWKIDLASPGEFPWQLSALAAADAASLTLDPFGGAG